MKKISFAIFLFFIFISNSCANNVNIYLENYYKLQESAVKLTLYFKDEPNLVGTCSGIIIIEDEHSTGILTAKHCVPPNIDKIVVNHKYITRTFQTANDIDVAYVEIHRSLLRYNPITIATSNAKIQDYVAFLGYPSKNYVYEMGIVYLLGIKNHYILMKSIPGCSGSGVINLKGELVGILWGGSLINLFNQKIDMTVMTPIEKIKPFLIKIKVWNKVRFD